MTRASVSTQAQLYDGVRAMPITVPHLVVPMVGPAIAALPVHLIQEV